MKVVLAGAFGKLGTDILKALIRDGYEVVAADMTEKSTPEIAGKSESAQRGRKGGSERIHLHFRDQGGQRSEGSHAPRQGDV